MILQVKLMKGESLGHLTNQTTCGKNFIVICNLSSISDVPALFVFVFLHFFGLTFSTCFSESNKKKPAKIVFRHCQIDKSNWRSSSNVSMVTRRVDV